ncbi:MAG: aldo/keto reductase [Sandaracinaceae bacterium]|nr:aldo/keto reductase [Sandaracinaceae bacterium]
MRRVYDSSARTSLAEYDGRVIERHRTVRGVPVPSFLYGTAWKEEDTRGLVERALAAGFRGIDTANQRKHYFEAAVGEGVRAALDRGEVSRDELFVQTKYTFARGQDHRLPYDPKAPIRDQVAQSLESSLAHFGFDAVDSLVLHGPMYRRGLADEDWEAWGAMERLHHAGKARLIGISNVTAEQLEELCGLAKIKPAFVQNRCYAEQGWDARVRAACAASGVVYQGFSLLTANGRALKRPEVEAVAARHGRSVAEVVFRFAMQLGMLPLTGTRDPDHMARDLTVYDFALSEADVDTLLRAR